MCCATPLLSTLTATAGRILPLTRERVEIRHSNNQYMLEVDILFFQYLIHVVTFQSDASLVSWEQVKVTHIIKVYLKKELCLNNLLG